MNWLRSYPRPPILSPKNPPKSYSIAENCSQATRMQKKSRALQIPTSLCPSVCMNSPHIELTSSPIPLFYFEVKIKSSSSHLKDET